MLGPSFLVQGVILGPSSLLCPLPPTVQSPIGNMDSEPLDYQRRPVFLNFGHIPPF